MLVQMNSIIVVCSISNAEVKHVFLPKSFVKSTTAYGNMNVIFMLCVFTSYMPEIWLKMKCRSVYVQEYVIDT
jgi:hypothetical protein